MTKRQKKLKRAYNIRRNNISKRDAVKKTVVTAKNADRFFKYYTAVYGTTG